MNHSRRCFEFCWMHILVCAIALVSAASFTLGQTTAPVTDPDAMTAINKLRSELVDAFNKGDVDRLVSHLDDDILITWQNGEVSHGPKGVRDYYGKMMGGPKPVVAKLSADPKVEERHVYGDWAVSWGNLRDHYVLTDGKSFDFNSRFTATIARRGAEWKVTAFHASVNAFDNPVMEITKKTVGTWVGIGAGVVGLVIGAIVGVMIGRRRRRTARPTGNEI